MTWDTQPGARPEPTELRSPFAGLAPGDAVRDAVAAALLLFSLTLPWDHYHLASHRLEVVLVTLLSLASLAAGYLARANAFGPALPPARAATARLLANVPYLVMFVIFLIVDLLAGADREAGGVGAAAAVGLAGALLAAQPREAELAARARPHPLERAWVTGPVVVAAAYVLTVLAGLTVFVISDEIRFTDGRGVAVTVLSLLVGFVMIGLPLFGLVRRDAAWRLVLIAVAVSPLGLYVVGKEGAVPAPMVESIHALSPGLVYWPALAVLVAAPAVRRAMRGPVAPWAGAAARLLTVAIVVAATAMLLAILAMIDTDQTVRRAILLGLAVLALVIVVVARMLPIASQPGARRGAFAAAAVLFAVGSIGLAVTAGDRLLWVSPTGLFLALVVPVGITVFLLVQMSQDARGLWALPPAPAAPPPHVPEEIRLAMDPATPPAILAELAARAPETWVHLARNPATYPDLLGWLAALGRPDVTEALSERGGPGQPQDHPQDDAGDAEDD